MKKRWGGAIELAYAPLMRILKADEEVKNSVIDYLNSFGDPLISESEYDDVETIVDVLIDMISMDLNEYFDEAEFLDDFYIGDIKDIEIFPAKQ